MDPSLAARTQECAGKLSRLRALLTERGLDALLLQRVGSFAWATGGSRSYVNIASTNGAAALLVTHTACHLVTDNLEAARLVEEEHLEDLGWAFHVREWHEPDLLGRLTSGLRLGADGPYPGALDLSPALARLRAHLTPEEGQRMAALAALAGQAVTAAAHAAQLGQPEQALSARLAYEAELRGLQAITNIVASDERLERYRHALPTDRPLGRHVMLVLNARRWGLVCTVTRFVHFGPLPAELLAQHQATAAIAGICIAATRPGCPLGEVLALAKAEYAALGQPDAWRLHHQGGSAGYEPREFLVTPGMTEAAVAGQAFVWNPSVGPARSVDMFLVRSAGNRVLTQDDAWPCWEVIAGGASCRRPAVLIL
jgi:Xaa-Pro aminopeptidase